MKYSWICLCFSVILNLLLASYVFICYDKQNELSWTRKAAKEAEDIASVFTSNQLEGANEEIDKTLLPSCECNSCYYGSDCSQFSADCPANADRSTSPKQNSTTLRTSNGKEIQLWKKKSLPPSVNFIEFVTSPNNPDGKLKDPVLRQGPSVKTINDHAYYWPHYTAIPAPANEDLMIFTLSKLTGHGSSRFGWALIKDQVVYYMLLNSMGVSRDTQLRALKLLKVLLGDGKEFFEFGHRTTRTRWESLDKVISASKRFSLQKFIPGYSIYFQNITAPSPAYAWIKCEKEEDENCYEALLRDGGIIGRSGSFFNAENRYVRLSLIKSQDDFDWLLQRMKNLVSQEQADEQYNVKMA
ncbi:hypothetical protein MKX03_016449 [Papaver bracteatum]|nr:hypothetical protein MKX03_016449 [Papaver bracteatum]